MSLTPQQQFRKLINTANDILILIPQDANGDVFAAALSLAIFLENQSKKVTLAGDTLRTLQERFAFLPEPKNALEALSGARDFILSFNTRYNKIMAVRSQEEDEEYRIYVTPEHGSIDPRDFSFIPAKFKFDLVIAIGTPDKEALGKIYEANADIFYEIPVVNIDHHPRNDNFGQLNFVDITASSVSEILTEILKEIDEALADTVIAECLLTGIIAATDSFQKKNTTPKALQSASYLMEQGADQQKIVRHLYKTQPLHLLKLWGRVMAQLKWSEEFKLVWSPVTIEDLVQSRAKTEDLPFILEKIKSHYSAGALFLLLFHEAPGTVRAIIKAHTREHLEKFHTLWPDGSLTNDSFEFFLSEESLEEAEKNVLRQLHSFLTSKH